jgi:hypothetical protein
MLYIERWQVDGRPFIDFHQNLSRDKDHERKMYLDP